jgi:hypothetical protein
MDAIWLSISFSLTDDDDDDKVKSKVSTLYSALSRHLFPLRFKHSAYHPILIILTLFSKLFYDFR